MNTFTPQLVHIVRKLVDIVPGCFVQGVLKDIEKMICRDVVLGWNHFLEGLRGGMQGMGAPSASKAIQQFLILLFCFRVEHGGIILQNGDAGKTLGCFITAYLMDTRIMLISGKRVIEV